MAVDTRDKRASVLGWGLASLLVLPAPGVIDQPDRQHVAYSYRGIAAAALVVIGADPIVIMVDAQNTTINVSAQDREILIPDERP